MAVGWISLLNVVGQEVNRIDFRYNVTFIDFNRSASIGDELTIFEGFSFPLVDALCYALCRSLVGVEFVD